LDEFRRGLKFRNYKPNNEEFKTLVMEKPEVETLEQNAAVLKSQPLKESSKEQLVRSPLDLKVFWRFSSRSPVCFPPNTLGPDEFGTKEAQLGFEERCGQEAGEAREEDEEGHHRDSQ